MDAVVLLRGFSLQMYRVTLNMYSLDGADVFASAAAHAQFRSGLRNSQTALKRNHVDGLYRAVLGTGSATGAVHVHYTDILVEYHAARLGAVLLLNRKRSDCTGRAYLATKVAVIVAVAVIKFHDRLHYSAQTVFHTGRFEHMAWALADAQMAGGAVLKQVPVADGAGRGHGHTLILLARYLGLKGGRSKGCNDQR